MTTLTDGLWNVTADEYHADRTRVRFSSLKDFDRNPELYYKRWVTGELKSSESDSLKIGSALHCSLLEPSKWEERYIIAPKVDRRTKQGKADWAQFEEEAKGRIILDDGEDQWILGMCQSVEREPRAVELLEQVESVEQPIAWDWQGLPMKCLCDGLGRKALVDVKTTNDIDSFGRSMQKYLYHAQAALYLEGVQHSFPLETQPEFRFLVIDKSAPYQCRVFSVSDRALKAGKEWCDRVRSDLIRARLFDTWHSPYLGQVVEVDLPSWAYGDSDD